jgi:nucleoside-diphosphate-sugar epimerase
VTGSNGFIGTKVVETLIDYGFSNLRCFVRPSSQTGQLEEVLSRAPLGKSIQLITGDLLSQDDCARATKDVSIVYHLAAGFDKSFAGAFMNSALATRNLVEAFLKHGLPKRFVNVSSFAVYSNLHMKHGALLDENCSLENAPQKRYDAYGFGKLKQEEVVREYGKNNGLPYVILRPGVVFGPGKRDLSGRVGTDTFGFFMHLGGSNLLPLTFVDNCAEAIVVSGLEPGLDGETFNVVDDDLLTSRQFLKAYKKHVKWFFSVWIPYPITYSLCLLWEKYSKWSKGQVPPAFNQRRCAADWKGNTYTNKKIRQSLGWKPKVNIEQAMISFLSQFESRIK